MVRGLDTFREHFSDFNHCYILIGGAACQQHFDEQGLTFRATKDLDLVLLVETLEKPFAEKFWEFIEAGGYGSKQTETNHHQYYRFLDPTNEKFPVQIELLSRRPDAIQAREGMIFTPIPTPEEISSLSAILLNDEYYDFARTNSSVKDGLSLADIVALASLKAFAFLNLSAARERGETVKGDDIKKHKNDVLRLATAINNEPVECPEIIRQDMRRYIETMEELNPDLSGIMKELGIPIMPLADLLNQLKTTFRTHE